MGSNVQNGFQNPSKFHSISTDAGLVDLGSEKFSILPQTRCSMFVLVPQDYTLRKVTYSCPFLVKLLQHAENITQDCTVSFCEMHFR